MGERQIVFFRRLSTTTRIIEKNKEKSKKEDRGIRSIGERPADKLKERKKKSKKKSKKLNES